MAYTLKLRKLAIKDLGAAYAWYEDKKSGLGEEFLLSADDVFELLKRNPELFDEKYPGIRKCNLRRFPYSVYYRLFNKQVTVLAVYHQSRNPRRWRKRHSPGQ